MSSFKEYLLLKGVFPIADLVMGTCAMKWYQQIAKMNTWSREEVIDWQTKQLHILMEQAYFHTRYYREVMDNLGMKPQDIKTLEDISLLPVMNRETIKERFNDIVPDNIKQHPYRKCATGGSTGQPMKYLCDENTWGFVTAMKIYSWKKTGYRYGDKFISLGSSSLFPVNKRSLTSEVYFRLRNTIPLNGMNMDDDTCRRYMDIIRKKKIRYIYGYATALYLLAKYCRDNNVDWHFYAAFSTAEKLTPLYRDVISETWDTQVMDCYGSRDGCITAYEVEPGNYHVGYASWLEASDKVPSELYATNLIDLAFPTIRYANYDEVLMWDSSVVSNYNGQILRDVIGRTSDVVAFDNGHRLTTSGFNSLFRGFSIEAFRIRKTGGRSILVQIQKRESYTQDEHELLFATIKKYVGDEITITFDYVDKFEPLKNGKRSFLLNE